MKYLSFGVVLVACAAGLAAQTPADKANDKTTKAPITLTGCVEAGKAANTFVLTHVVKGDSTAQTPLPRPSIDNPTATPPIVAPPTTTPPTEQPTATSGAEPAADAAIYSLDPPDKVKAHLGHKIFVTGTLADDMDKTTVKDNSGTAAPADSKAGGNEKQEAYKLKVKSIRMISSSCS